MDLLIEVVRSGLSVALTTAIWLGVYYSKLGQRSKLNASVGAFGIMLLSTMVKGSFSSVMLYGFFGGVLSGSLIVTMLAKRNQKMLLAEAKAEEGRQAVAALSAKRAEEARVVAEKAAADEREREEAKKKAENDALKVRLREERERSGAEKALHGHVEVITSAVRSIRRDADNAVLINTIDSELKAIARNERITGAMLTQPDLKDDVEIILQMLAERGVDDKILLNRLQKVFQLNAAA